MNEEINYNITGDNKIKKIFKIPVGNKSRKEANDIIDKLKKEFDKKNLSYTTDTDIILDDGTVFTDWNKFSMDELADYLEKKYMFLSSGEALAIHKLVQFYREHK